ncbi:MAG TPA: RES family NAD+ phosphorylase [Lichenihabitans sp.]|jgi:RES domain-containing protein|nr:RES family NAD+ phosphorylase [Lichenihabitans sp.]
MRAWRICREPFADLSGEGARLHGGRWNSPGRPLVYAAASAALAVLEVRVHLDLSWDVLPDDYVLIEIDLDAAGLETVEVLPADPLAFGNEWLAARRSAVLEVPSAIVPEARNRLLNPLHPDAGRVLTVGRRSFRFDARLWLPW